MTSSSSMDMHLSRSGEVTCRNYSRLGYERLAHGVYGHSPEVSGLDWWAARRAQFLTFVQAVMRNYSDKDIALYGVTALQVLGVELPAEVEDWETCHVVVPVGAYRPRRRSVISHRSIQPLSIWDRKDNLPLLHPVDHWLQVSGAGDDVMVEIGDGLMRRQRPLLSEESIRSHLLSMRSVAGLPQARRALHWMRAGTDSIAETRTRLALVHAGLPCPEVNHPVYCRSVGRVFHVDMGYPQEKVAVEYDGTVHVGDRRQMEIDAVRRRALQEEGWLLITITADQLRRPVESIRAVEAALVLRRAAHRMSRGSTAVLGASNLDALTHN